jgi:hypothetical protein
MAAGLLVDLVEGRGIDPAFGCRIQTARLARDREGLPISAALASLRATWGRRAVELAVASLVSLGYLDEVTASFNFSGDRLLAYHRTSDDAVT